MHVRRFLLAPLLAAAALVWATAGARAADGPAHDGPAHDEHAAASTGQAGHHGHTGHEEHIGLADADLGEVLKPEEIRSDLAFFTFVVFLLLLAILWKFAWGPIVAGLEMREESIAHNIADAQRQHDESKQLLASYEAKLTAAAEEVRGILEQARRDAEHTKQSILAEAKSGAEAERLRSLREIETATDVALQSLAARAGDLAIELAGKIVHKSLSATDHAQLIREAVAKFPTAAPSKN